MLEEVYFTCVIRMKGYNSDRMIFISFKFNATQSYKHTL